MSVLPGKKALSLRIHVTHDFHALFLSSRRNLFLLSCTTRIRMYIFQFQRRKMQGNFLESYRTETRSLAASSVQICRAPFGSLATSSGRRPMAKLGRVTSSHARPTSTPPVVIPLAYVVAIPASADYRARRDNNSVAVRK